MGGLPVLPQGQENLSGSDRISEWRIMSDNARTNDAPAGPSGGRLDPLAKVFTPKVRDERDFYVREREWERTHAAPRPRLLVAFPSWYCR